MSHPSQTIRHLSVQDDEHSDEDDDIVGSYLADNDLDFLNAWSSINSTKPPVPSSSQSTWTPPLYHPEPHLQQATSTHDSTLSMAAQYPSQPAPGSSHATAQQHQQQQQVPTSHTKTVRKSSSGRKLKPQSSVSNLASGTTTTLPDPSLFPDPYPSVFGAAATNPSTTPPVSLFSAGSSSARSSAYTSASPASALRSSVASSDSAHNARHQPPPPFLPSPTRLSVGDTMITNFPHLISHSQEPPVPHQVGLASTADETVQLRDVEQQLNSAVTARPTHGSATATTAATAFGSSRPGSRPGTDYGVVVEKTRWSSSSAASQISKTSSWGNFHPEGSNHRQSGAHSRSHEWNHPVVDERDVEFATDDDEGHEDDEMERTSAVVLAEQGHGEIVHGEGKDVMELYVPPNTTHLLLGSSATPNQLPSFIINVLPPISHSLLALDISANFLVSLPLPLAACRNLEELNIGSNPIRVLPTWLAVLTNLRVLIADSIGISTIPSTLSGAVQLHTLSVRNNRMHALPSWLCLLPALEALYLEGNPFQGPWKALVEPLISRSLLQPPLTQSPIPMAAPSPFYLPNTPHTPNSLTSTDPSEYSEEKPVEPPMGTLGGPPPPLVPASVPAKPTFTKGHRATSSKDFKSNATFTPGDRPATSGGRSRALTLDREKEANSGMGIARSRPMPQEPTSPRPYTSFSTHDAIGARSLSRTKTAPSRRPSTSNNSIGSLLQPSSDSHRMGRESPAGSVSFGRMPSAGRSTEMLNGNGNGINGAGADRLPTPTGEYAGDRGQSPSMVRKMKSTGDMKLAAMAPSSSPSSTSVNDATASQENSSAEFGVNANAPGLGKFMSVGARGPMKEEYRALTATMFETPSNMVNPQAATVRGGGTGKEKERSKWGFLKKMSKSRLRSGSNAHEEDGHGRTGSTLASSISGPSVHSIGPPRAMGGMGGPSESMPLIPHSSSGNTTPAITQPSLMTASQVGFRSSTALNQTSSQRRVLSKRPTDQMNQNSFSMISNQSHPTLPPSSASASSSSTGTFAYTNSMASSQPPTPGYLAPPVATAAGPTQRKMKRRSFLPVDGPAPLNIVATQQGSSNFLAIDSTFDHESYGNGLESPSYSSTAGPATPAIESEQKQRERHQRALRSVMGYLKDMCDLSAGTSAGAVAIAAAVAATQAQVNSSPNFSHFSPSSESKPPSRGPSSRAGSRRPTLASADASRALSDFSAMSLSLSNALSGGAANPSPTFGPSSNSSHPPSLYPGRTPSFSNLAEGGMNEPEMALDSPPVEEKKVKDDKVKRAMIVKEIVTTERTYVKLLQELVDIYVTPAAAPVTGIANVSTKETMVPATERKIVFNGLESLLSFHKESFLPSLEKAYLTLESADDVDGQASSQAAIKVAQVFVSHAAFMRMYSTYINNFDNALRRTKQWTDKNLAAAVVGSGNAAAGISGSNAANETASGINLTPSQRKRIRQYLKRCRANPRHSQMNMESYLLLPVQRIPRYRLLFEELVRATPPSPEAVENVLQRALDEITVLASNMNEGKREAESRRKLVHWQARIRGKFPSPLVQPHRRLIMDGRLQLTRVVRKLANYFEVINASGEKTLVSVECLAPEVTPRPLVAILCNDLLVLCKDPSGGRDPTGQVDLWAVLRMQTVQQPASIMHGSSLRLVDNKAILYFDLPSTTEALTWSRAINMHIPASSK